MLCACVLRSNAGALDGTDEDAEAPLAALHPETVLSLAHLQCALQRQSPQLPHALLMTIGVPGLARDRVHGAVLL